MSQAILMLLAVFSPLLLVPVICALQQVPLRKLLHARATKVAALAMGLHLFVAFWLFVGATSDPTPPAILLAIAVAYPLVLVGPSTTLGGVLLIAAASISWGVAAAVSDAFLRPMAQHFWRTRQFSLRTLLIGMTVIAVALGLISFAVRLI
jgi:hypothetical protein